MPGAQVIRAQAQRASGLLQGVDRHADGFKIPPEPRLCLQNRQGKMNFRVVQLLSHCREAVEQKLSAAATAVPQKFPSQAFVGFGRQILFSQYDLARARRRDPRRLSGKLMTGRAAAPVSHRDDLKHRYTRS
ncbi:hypothetical protein SDC9_195183 [bioreactor metagenome]|uniref:Uncharacterized protein n=1 Tax=bioreactor metagenome TaxID=1076179 RepID=A0A645I8Y4_9ZZZZ